MTSKEGVCFYFGNHEQGMCHQTKAKSFEILVEKRGRN